MNNFLSHIEIDPQVRFGKPCIKGTRIAVGDVLGWLSMGMTWEQIVHDFPKLSLDDIQAALAYAAYRESGRIVIAA